MNTEHNSSDGAMRNEDREALLTAYALGQVSEDERAAAEAILAAHDAAAARQHVAEMAHIAAALVAGRAHDLPERSADLRRAVVAAVARTGSPITPPVPFAKRGRVMRWIVGAGVITASIAVVVTMMLPAVQDSRETAWRYDDTGEQGSSDDVSVPQLPGLGASGPGRAQPRAGGIGGAGAPMPSLTPEYGRSVTSSGEQGQPGQQGQGQVWGQGEGQGEEVIDSPVLPEPLVGLADDAETPIAFPSQERWRKITKLGDQLKSTEVAREMPATDPVLAKPRPAPLANGYQATGEQYNRFTENGFLAPADHPLSTFSIDVDTASYANTRRFLMAGQRPPRDAVRIEEFVNYFRYDDPAPKGEVPFSVNVEAADCPWRPTNKIVRIGLAGRDVARDQRPAGNLVFLVDVSGSMADADKLPLVQQSLLMLVDELTENDRVALVTYAGNAGLVLPSTSGDQKEKIRAAIESLSSGGSTHGSAGITLAYEQAAERFIQGGANRVILATDGDLNVGVTSDEALVELITQMAKGGTFLTVLGFGQGNLQDEKMEKLADKGNGVYAYIDSVREARKVLVEQLTGSTITIAKDVKIQVEFNPARVASYRLLGYENRALADRDFRDDKKDAGEIGAGHGVTALYEIELVSDGEARESSGAEPLKYQPQPKREAAPKPAPVSDEDVSRELLTVKLRYKQPDGDTSRLLEVPLSEVGARFDEASKNLRFASAVAAFGMILRGSEHAGDATLPMVAKIAAGALGDDRGGYRAEFLDLVRRAEQAR